MFNRHGTTLALIILLSISTPGHAARTFWDSEPGITVDLVWDGTSGNQTVSGSSGCVISLRNPFDANPDQPRTFGIAAGNDFDTNAPLSFTLSNTAMTDSLQVSVEYNGVVINDNFTGNQTFAGGGTIGPNSCPAANVGAFTMIVDEISLKSMEPDIYTEQFRFCAVRGINRENKCDGTPTTDGAFGETVFIDFTVTINPFVLVEGLDDIDLGSYVLGNDPSNSDSFCIGTNVPAGATIITTSDSSSTGFHLTGATAGDEIPYTVTLTDSNGTNHSLSEGGIGLSLMQSQLDDLNCNGTTGGNVTMTVTATAANVDNAPSDAYTDTITLTITPN